MNNIYIKTEVFSKWIREHFYRNKDIITLQDLIYDLEDAYDNLEIVKEQFEDYKKDVEDNYKPISVSEQVD